MNTLTEQQMRTIQDAARKLTAAKRRAFQAQVALDYLDGKQRRAETVFGTRSSTTFDAKTKLRTRVRILYGFPLIAKRKSILGTSLEVANCAASRPRKHPITTCSQKKTGSFRNPRRVIRSADDSLRNATGNQRLYRGLSRAMVVGQPSPLRSHSAIGHQP